MNHFTTPLFWETYKKLPSEVQKISDEKFELLKENPYHPSLHFKKVNNYYSVRIGLRYRSLAVEVDEGLLWFWIGTHAEYDSIL